MARLLKRMQKLEKMKPPVSMEKMMWPTSGRKRGYTRVASLFYGHHIAWLSHACTRATDAKASFIQVGGRGHRYLPPKAVHNECLREDIVIPIMLPIFSRHDIYFIDCLHCILAGCRWNDPVDNRSPPWLRSSWTPLLKNVLLCPVHSAALPPLRVPPQLENGSREGIWSRGRAAEFKELKEYDFLTGSRGASEPGGTIKT